jgi:DNA-binding XRE family transcriptional regulator
MFALWSLPLSITLRWSMARFYAKTILLPEEKVANIRELRDLAHWSQFQLAAATGIDRTRLSFIENKHVTPSAEEQAIIEQALLGEISRRNERLSAVLTGAKA